MSTSRNLLHPRVWAPCAQRVDLILDDAHHPMHPLPDGWWEAPTALTPGQLYAFSLDGGPALPDPRSLAQPEGVHGRSQVVDPSLFVTDRPAWPGRRLGGAVLYELHVGTFTPEGTLDAAARKLPELVELGVDAVELMPIADFPGIRGWGYDGVGLYAVHQAYGGPEALVRFIDAAHTVGLGVILDVVHNHVGPEGNYLGQFGPYFTDDYSTPWGPAVNLDGSGSEQVRAFLLGSVRQWIVDYGIDGLRLDAVHELMDASELHFLADLSQVAAELETQVGRPITVIAEADVNQPAMVSPVGSVPQARGMHAQWADDIHHAIHCFVTGETHGYYWDFQHLDALEKALTSVFVHDGTYSSFREQVWGAPVQPDVDLYDGHSFVAFMQNHDQVGNRPDGARITTQAPLDLVAAGAALYLLSAFTPMIFMGEEWAASTPFAFFSDLGEELGPLVSQGRAQEFAAMSGQGVEVPDPQSPTTFDASTLRWEERHQEPHSRMWQWYQQLIALRREPDFAHPSLTSVSVARVDEGSLMMHRGCYTVCVTRHGATFPVTGEVVASWESPVLTEEGVLITGPGVAVVLRADSSGS